MISNFCATRALWFDSASDPCGAAVSALLDKEGEGREEREREREGMRGEGREKGRIHREKMEEEKERHGEEEEN